MVKLFDIETPALIIDLDILEENILKMFDFIKNKNIKLRPHFKTSKCVEISRLELEAGAVGITCSKVGEAEVLVNAGINNILIANQIVDRMKINRLSKLAHKEKITVAVDNAYNIDDLSQIAEREGVNLHVLVEINVGMDRCGVNTKEEALVLAKRIMDSRGLVFEGLQAYEGHVCFIPDRTERVAAVEKINKKLIDIKNCFKVNGIDIKEISGGGTGTFDITSYNTVWTELQTGSYVFMDNTYIDDVGIEYFKSSLTVLTQVIHKRPGIAVTDAGKKACANDCGNPTIKGYPDVTVKLNEEHGILEDREDKLSYLQKVQYFPGHCCTTTNLYDRYHCIRNGVLKSIWTVDARGKSQ